MSLNGGGFADAPGYRVGGKTGTAEKAGAGGYFDDGGFPVGKGWDEIAFPAVNDEHAYALEVSGNSMEPAYRDGDMKAHRKIAEGTALIEVIQKAAELVGHRLRGQVLAAGPFEELAFRYPAAEVIELHHAGKADAPSGTAATASEIVEPTSASTSACGSLSGSLPPAWARSGLEVSPSMLTAVITLIPRSSSSSTS